VDIAVSDGEFFGRNIYEILRQKLSTKMSERDGKIVIVSLMLEDFYDLKHFPDIANQALFDKLGWFEGILAEFGMSDLLDKVELKEGVVSGGQFLQGTWK